MARCRFYPQALVGSSDYGKYKAAHDMQPVRFVIVTKWFTTCFGEEIEISKEKAAELGDLAFCKQFKKRI